MEYNCKHCKEYWENILGDLLDAIGTDNEHLLKLYCPRCKRTKREW